MRGGPGGLGAGRGGPGGSDYTEPTSSASSTSDSELIASAADFIARTPRALDFPGGNAVVDLGVFWPVYAFLTGVTDTTPVEVETSGAHGYTAGELVRIKNVPGVVGVNGPQTVGEVTSRTTFTLAGTSAGGAWTGAAGSDPDTSPVAHGLSSLVWWWEAWVCPADQSGGAYWISDSGSGAHLVLCGAQGVWPTSPVDGNFSGSIGAGVRISNLFGGHTSITVGEWAYVAVGCDGQFVRTYVNGVCTGKSAITITERWGLTTSGGGHPFLGGPIGHETWVGKIGAVRAFDPHSSETRKPNFFDPTANKLELAFRPERVFGPGVGDTPNNEFIAADGVWNFTAGNLLDSSGNGRNGIKHNGITKNSTEETFALNGRAELRSADFGPRASFTFDRSCPLRLRPFALVVGASNTTPVEIETDEPHGCETGDPVIVDAVGGNTGANGSFLVDVVDETHLTLRDSVGTGAYTSGGNLNPGAVEQERTPIATPSGAIVWDSFSRRNRTYAYEPASQISLGRTEAGSAGRLTWQTGRNPHFGAPTAGYAPYGIIDGNAFFAGDAGGYYAYVDPGVSAGCSLFIDGQSGTWALGSAALIFKRVDANNFRVAIWDREAQALVVAQVVGGSYVAPDAGAVSVTSIAAIAGTSYAIDLDPDGETFAFRIGLTQAALLAGGGTVVRTHLGQTTNPTGSGHGLYHEADNSKSSSLWRYGRFLVK